MRVSAHVCICVKQGTSSCDYGGRQVSWSVANKLGMQEELTFPLWSKEERNRCTRSKVVRRKERSCTHHFVTFRLSLD